MSAHNHTMCVLGGAMHLAHSFKNSGALIRRCANTRCLCV